MSRSSVRALLVAGLMAVTTAGCSVLDPRPDGSRYFMLRSLAVHQDAALDQLVLGLGPVTIPEYMDANEMIDLVGPYEVRYSAQNRWVEPLGGQIVRTLSENLDALLSPNAIVSHPWFAQDGVDLQVEVVFHPIRMGEDGAWVGSADWVIREPVSRIALEKGGFSFDLGQGAIPPDQIASGLSTEIERLAAEIAVGVRRHAG